MKKLMITLIAIFFVGLFGVKAVSNERTYSHLPLEIEAVLKNELANPIIKAPSAMSGDIYLEFYVNEKREIVITSLSSNNLQLGSFIVNVLSNLPQLSNCCTPGKTYNIKALVSYR